MTTEPQPPKPDLLAPLERAARAARVSIESEFLGVGYWLDVDGVAIHNPAGGNWPSASAAIDWWDAHGAEWMGGTPEDPTP